jgi:hypothetical protein
MKALIIDALTKETEVSASKFCWTLAEYKHAFSNDFNKWVQLDKQITAAFHELHKANVLSCRTELFDCGAGNGLAVEHYYKLN